MTDSERDARDLPASEDARRSGDWVPGIIQKSPRDLIDWHYGSSPFCAELQSERLLAFRRAEHGESEAEFPEWLGSPRPAQVAAVNDNRRLWVVR